MSTLLDRQYAAKGICVGPGDPRVARGGRLGLSKRLSMEFHDAKDDAYGVADRDAGRAWA